MNADQLARQLRAEGYVHTYLWEDAPYAKYPGHAHSTETTHIILEGELTLTMDGRSVTYRSGERCDVPAGAVHTANMGSMGCRYLIGEK